MAKLIGYDVSGVEEGGGGEQPQPGVYPAEIVEVVQRTENAQGGPANDLKVTLKLGGDYSYVYTYIGLGEAAAWKLAEFTRALDLPEKGKFDPEKLKGKMIRVKINAGSYGDDYKGEAGRLMKTQDGDELAATGSSPASGGGVTPDEPDDAGSSDGFTPTREDDGPYDDWSDEDLLAEVEDRGLVLPGGRGAKKDKAITALRADDEAGVLPVGEESGVDADGDKVYADPGFVPSREDADDEEVGLYDAWAPEDLAAECADRGLTVAKGRGAAAKNMATLRVEDAEVLGGGGDDAAPAGSDEDYSAWSLQELSDEWVKRNMGDLPVIRGRNAEARLIAKMAEDILADDQTDPFAA